MSRSPNFSDLRSLASASNSSCIFDAAKISSLDTFSPCEIFKINYINLVFNFKVNSELTNTRRVNGLLSNIIFASARNAGLRLKCKYPTVINRGMPIVTTIVMYTMNVGKISNSTG